MLEWVDAKCVGENCSDHEPSLPGVMVPSSWPWAELRSPLIQTSIRSMLPASLTEPVMVKLDFVDTFAFSVGAVTVRIGAAPDAGADGADGAGAAGAAVPV